MTQLFWLLSHMKNSSPIQCIPNPFKNHFLSLVWVWNRLWNLWWEKVWLSLNHFPTWIIFLPSLWNLCFSRLNFRPEVEREKSNMGQRGLPWGITFIILTQKESGLAMCNNQRTISNKAIILYIYGLQAIWIVIFF